MTFKNLCLAVFYALMLTANPAFAQDADFSPVKVRPARATYSKITISWQPGSSATQAAYYKILRDNSEVATSTTLQYTDENLQNGTEYIYKVIAVSSSEENSPASAELKVKTIKSVSFDNSSSVELLVDQFYDVNVLTAATTFVTAVKSGLEALLNTNITFSCVDPDILNDYVAEEFALIQGASTEMTDAEYQAARAELDKVLDDDFGGNSFEHVYIHGKLTELAEKHWQQGHKDIAKTLYEFSLNYLNDQEKFVFNVLCRLGKLELAEITSESSNAEMAAALNAQYGHYCRFFDFFTDSTSRQALYSLRLPAWEYFTRFPSLLAYSVYDQNVFANARQAAQAALNIDSGDTQIQKLFDRIDAWELVNQQLTFQDSAGNPVTGTLTATNITTDTDKKYYFYDNENFNYIDERQFTVTDGELLVPAYKGHIYKLSFAFNVAGGNPIRFTTVGSPTAAGKIVTYNNFNEPVLTDGDSDASKTVFVVDRPTYPYNLTSTAAIDVFNLSWDWVNSDTFTATHFKVFRGTTELADVTGQPALNIPLCSPDGISSYTVVAYDADGNASTASQPLVVVPGDQTVYADFFAWMANYFGDQAMYSCDDPDGDGINNYQEFLNGTDPTRIPGPTAYVGQQTYTKITLQWDEFLPGESGVSFKVFRNGTEVGTTAENSFTDSGLTPGVAFSYKVKAIRADGSDTEFSPEFSARTIAPASGSYASELQQIVDQFNPIDLTQYTSASLISAVKSGLEAILGTNITFSVVDDSILDDFVSEELAIINGATPIMTDAERLAAQTELAKILDDDFGGHTFEHVYIYGKLTELGEKHWLAGHKTAARELYSCALNYLSDQENCVFDVLSSLARFELDEISDTSTNAEIITALNNHRDQYLRFFTFFDNSTSQWAGYAYRVPAIQYFKRFPRLLTYSDYNQPVFASAQQIAQAALNLKPTDEHLQKNCEKIDAWELVNQKIVCQDSAGNPVVGSLTIKNITAGSEKKYYFYDGDAAPADERQFTVNDGEVSFSAYKGHIYETTFYFDVAGGNPIIFKTTGTPTETGKIVTYDNFGTPVLSNSTSGESGSFFVVDRPTYPYNLSSTSTIDLFTLSWDWVNSDTFTATHFKVFRGAAEIADVTSQSVANIPFYSPDGVSSYTVVAYDASGNASATSPVLLVGPGAQDPYADYHVWMQSYFGDQAMYHCDDPDGDGVNNYQEFLNGTDPGRVPGPIIYSRQQSYTKITLQWDAMFTGKTGVGYKIFRNNVEVGTASTNSFTDSNLTPGMTFAYKVSAFADGVESECGTTLSLKTMAPETTSYASELLQIVDQFNPLDSAQYTTSASLVSAVKSGLEAILGTNITFSVIDNNILDDFVSEELSIINGATPIMTDAERLTAQTELDKILDEGFGGHTFEQVYMYGKLTELAEKHWQAGHKTAGKELYNCALNYLSDQENYVFDVLSSLARFELDEITDTSTNAEIITALNNHRDQYLRFFTFFDNSTSQLAGYAYRIPGIEYFKRFPLLLTYGDYNQPLFDTASQLVQAAFAINGSEPVRRKYNEIAAWELMNLDISIIKPDGTPAAGTLVFKNISDELFYYSENDQPEEREFRIDGSTVTVPVYVGHKYKILTSFDVVGGPAIQYTIEALPHAKGQKTIYDLYSPAATQELTDGQTNGELVFITDQPQTPYNLRAATLQDTFTLSWDWVAPTADYQLECFKVYCGGVEIGEVTQQQMDNIPRAAGVNSRYDYTVVAVDVNGNMTSPSPLLCVLPLLTDEEQAYFDWKTGYFGDAVILANQDQDEDGLTNWEEFLLGSNPTVAPVANPKAGLTIAPGIKAGYYKGFFSRIPDFSTMTPYKTDILDTFYMPETSENILTSEQTDSIAVLLTAYFDVDVSGWYRFSLENRDYAKVYIDNTLVINRDWAGYHLSFVDRYLTAGTHSFRLEYCDGSDETQLMLLWSGPDFSNKIMDSSVLWHTNDDDSVLTEVIAWQRDSDFDGIRDLEEISNNTNKNSTDSDGDGLSDYDEIYTYHTDPNSADTDSDGVSDYDEVKFAFTNPLQAEFDGTSTLLQTVNGSDFISSSSGWEKEGDAVYCSTRNGSITYNLAIPERGCYVLDLSGSEYNSFASTSKFNIELYVNDRSCGSLVLQTAGTEAGTIRFFLPELEAGTAVAKVVWTNVESNTYLQINSLAIKALGGIDSDNDGQADWVENRLANLAAALIPESSKTSPVCIEGSNAMGLEDITISMVGKPSLNANENSWKLPWRDESNSSILWLSQNTPPEETAAYTTVVPQAARGARNTWYADIPLYPGGNGGNNGGLSTITVSLGDESVSGNITWTPTNIMIDEDMTIRAGDSLLLVASGAANETGAVTITVNGENFTTDERGKVPYKFENAGTYTVTATFTPDNGDPAVTGEISVKVVTASFAGIPYAIIRLDRDWPNPQIPREAVLDYDDSLKVFRALQPDGSSNIAFCGITMGDAYMTARLGKNGPVMAAAKLNIIDVETHRSSGYYTVVDTFSDGSTLIEGKIILSMVPEDLVIKLKIFTAGTTFLDGTIEKTLTAADFDANGVCRYQMLKSPESKTSTCHGVYFFQNESQLYPYKSW